MGIVVALGVAAGLVAIAAYAFFLWIPRTIERRRNFCHARPPYRVPDRAAALHATLFVADLHCDALLWDRDLVRRNDRGFLDLPRMRDGNLALQNFMAVTKTPRGQNFDRTDDRTDNITILAVAERWPVPAWSSLKQRALYLARKLHGFAARSGGGLVVVRTAADLAAFRERRARQPGLVAGVLGIEGAHALEGDPANLDAMFDAGYRVLGLSHFFDNEMAGSMHGVRKHGLTERGREALARAEGLRMIVDLAHASCATLDEVLATATRPVIVSHTGVKGTLDNNRNLSDDQLRRIAATGGLIGVGFWDDAVGPIDDLANVARAIRHAVNVAGVEAVGLGSDADGATPMPMEASGLALLTEALLEDGFSEVEIRKVMGENQARLYRDLLP
jgi:microsomal dipeptidase-like Zn-dependent dipeptidase